MKSLNFKDLLARYQSGERQFQEVVITQADAFQCDLRDIKLSAAVIGNAYLPYSNLSRANLQDIVIKQGNLCDAKLSNSDLSRGQLSGVNLSRADLRYSCLRRANLINCNLTGADLTGADLTGADLTGTDLTGAELSNVQMHDTCLVGATLFRASNVNIAEARCDRTTIMPDGHYYP
ncbi:MAG: pentapeptide repeat-containing protein [Cyanobacteria bacterium P01_D01_bin.6]